MQMGSIIINLPPAKREVVTPGPEGGGECVRAEVGVMLPIQAELPLRSPVLGDPDRNTNVAPAVSFPIATRAVPRHYSWQIYI